MILAAVTAWGVTGALGRLNGMFAIALWDGESRSLTLARDRFRVERDRAQERALSLDLLAQPVHQVHRVPAVVLVAIAAFIVWSLIGPDSPCGS